MIHCNETNKQVERYFVNVTLSIAKKRISTVPSFRIREIVENIFVLFAIINLDR